MRIAVLLSPLLVLIISDGTGADLAIWQTNYDPIGVHLNTFGIGDWDHDGRINGADLASWQQNYDPIGSRDVGEFQSVPEPASMLMVGSGLIVVLGRVSRRRGKRMSTLSVSRHDEKTAWNRGRAVPPC